MKTNKNLKQRKHQWQLIAIILASVVAGSSVFIYTATVSSNAKSEQKLVDVYLAQTPIASGVSLGAALADGSIQVKGFPSGSRPAGSIVSINSSNTNLVAKQLIQPGQILTTALFALTAANTGALNIPEGMLAVTIPMADPAKVASFLQPGSEVAIFVTGSLQGQGPESTQVLLPRVTVLAVGDQVADMSQATINASLITLALTPIEAKKIIYASKNLTLYFGLRTDDVEVGGTTAITSNNLLANKN